MAMDTWLMQGGWGFLDASEIDPLLDKMEEAEIRHLAFGGPLPLAPEPRHYEGPLKGCPPPPATRARGQDKVFPGSGLEPQSAHLQLRRQRPYVRCLRVLPALAQ